MYGKRIYRLYAFGISRQSKCRNEIYKQIGERFLTSTNQLHWPQVEISSYHIQMEIDTLVFGILVLKKIIIVIYICL